MKQTGQGDSSPSGLLPQKNLRTGLSRSGGDFIFLFAKAEVLLHSLFNSNCASYCCTDHGVVTHAMSKKFTVTRSDLQ